MKKAKGGMKWWENEEIRLRIELQWKLLFVERTINIKINFASNSKSTTWNEGLKSCVTP